jgi:hypothetical protein
MRNYVSAHIRKCRFLQGLPQHFGIQRVHNQERRRAEALETQAGSVVACNSCGLVFREGTRTGAGIFT